jgi:ParB/RepB/Spo0J family partition protein
MAQAILIKEAKMTTTDGQSGFRAISLEQLQVSGTESQAQRRKHFDKAALAELADSIKKIGVMQPIIARPVNGHFEVVAGERRLIAAKAAGLSEIDVNVRPFTDEQVIEIQLIENLQREGLHPLAEAEGYDKLQGYGHSAEEIADKIGKSKNYVYQRLKLCSLAKASRTAFYDGKLTASTALLLARIPTEDNQIKALKEITTPRYGGELMSFRDAAAHIRDNYMTNLSDAGFPTEDVTLVAVAGPCGACPKRTGNQAELFGDVKSGNVCTDPTCFKAKREANAARVIALATESGQTVVTGAAAKKIIPYRDSLSQGFEKLTEKPWDDKKKRTYAQLLGKDFEPTLVQHPDTGVIVKLVPPAAVKEALRAAGIRQGISPGSSTQSAAEKKAKAERKFRDALFIKVRENYPASLARDDWNALGAAIVHEMQHETCKRLFALWGWEAKNEGYGRSFSKAAAINIAKLSGPDVAKFFFDCVFVSDLQVSTWSDAKPEVLFAGAKRFKVNVEQLRRQQNAAQIPKAKKKAKAKK